nr:calponin-3-like [Salvelinus alpinus]
MTSFNKGPAYGLSAEVKSKIAGKYDMQKEEELRFWIEEVTGMAIGENFQKGLKDGIVLGELINKLQPGSIKKINHSQLNWHKVSDLRHRYLTPSTGIVPSVNRYLTLRYRYLDLRYRYLNLRHSIDLRRTGMQTSVTGQTSVHKGIRPPSQVSDLPSHSIRPPVTANLTSVTAMLNLRQATDLRHSYLNLRHSYLNLPAQPPHSYLTVRQQLSDLVTANLTSRHKLSDTPSTGIFDLRYRYAEPPLRYLTSVTQMGTNKCASQAGMTAYGTRRHLYDPKTQTDKPYDQTTISLQMGTNKGASQAGMSCPGTRRDIFDNKQVQQVDNSTISLQMGTNKAASQKGMSAYGLGRQVYDPKYCGPPTEPVIHADGSLGTNCSEISDSDYQAEEFLQEGEEYPAYHEEDNYSDVAHYNEVDQGIDY